MPALRVRHHDASIQVTVKLTRFIADWPAAQQKFIGGMAEGFRDWLPISAGNFSITPALALDDLRCRCQLFGGACSIELAPDALRLNFSAVRRRDQPQVIETVRRSLDWLAGALGENGRDWMSFNTSAHMQAPDDANVDEYLGQFVPEGVDSVLQIEPGAKYLPSTRVTCSDENGRWILLRVVEKSTEVDNGVYVDTRIDIRAPDPAGFGDHVDLLARLDTLANIDTRLAEKCVAGPRGSGRGGRGGRPAGNRLVHEGRGTADCRRSRAAPVGSHDLSHTGC